MQGLARLAKGGPALTQAARLIGAESASLLDLRFSHGSSAPQPVAKQTDSHVEHVEGGVAASEGAQLEEGLGGAAASGAGSRRRERRGARGADRQPALHPAYLANVSRCLTRQDVADFFSDYGLDPYEVRVQYSKDNEFVVERFWCNFPSRQARDRALERRVSYLGSRRAVVRAATPQEFRDAVYHPLAMSSRGRYVLVSGLAEQATSEDVLRYFQGYGVHAKSVTFVREQQGLRGNLGKAVIRFDSPDEAHRAVRSKQGGFVANSQVYLRLLQ